MQADTLLREVKENVLLCCQTLYNLVKGVLEKESRLFAEGVEVDCLEGDMKLFKVWEEERGKKSGESSEKMRRFVLETHLTLVRRREVKVQAWGDGGKQVTTHTFLIPLLSRSRGIRAKKM
eukprot:765947-Hanusia_phi.AAC.4